MTARPAPHRREDYRHERLITTRWMDNDAYGHVNNVVYYSWFDTVVNAWLIERGLLDIERSPSFGAVIRNLARIFLASNPSTASILDLASVDNSGFTS